MRFHQQQHEFYCGVDRHAKTMHVCVVDQAGETRVHRNIETRPDRFLQLIRRLRAVRSMPRERTTPAQTIARHESKGLSRSQLVRHGKLNEPNQRAPS